MNGIDLQIHVLRVCDRQLKKLPPLARISVLKMLLDAVDESEAQASTKADKTLPLPGVG